jgi:putative ABC transport system permease protein
MAETFFGTENPIGKTLSHHDYGVFTVTGVLKPYKRGTHFRSDAMVSMKTYKQFSKENLKKDLSAYTYVLIKQNSDKKDLDAALAMSAANTNTEIAQSKDAFHYRKATCY